jgi:hypothetical protein
VTIRVDVTLGSKKGGRFEEVRDELEEELGYRPDPAETISHLLRSWDGVE